MLLTIVATLPFLAALSIAALALASTVGESKSKILLALQGRSPAAEPMLVTRPVTVRFSARQAPARRTAVARPQWRAAA